MKNIKDLTDEMKEELADAKKYAHCYQTKKEDNPVLAKKYYEMSQDELKHAMYIHDMAVQVVDELTNEDVSFPEYMAMVWEEKHENYIDEMAIIKNILAM